MGKVLIVDDDVALARSVASNLSGFDLELASSPDEARAKISQADPDVVLLDLGYPDDVTVGLGLLGDLAGSHPHAKIVVMTGFGSREVGARAVKQGAYAYIEKPVRDFQSLRVILHQASQISGLEREIQKLRESESVSSRWGIIGTSPAVQTIRRQIGEVGPTPATVLIEGESGTGKELVAHAIHEASGRKGPFVVLDCTAIPENLFEDKLFGHERGAFTGAATSAEGALERADGGTLFIDEIGELPPLMQSKLLRFLQEKSFQRIGSHEERRVDLRVVAATNRNLKEEVERGRFREDLFYRLHVYSMTLPPLRGRREDIPPLVSHLLKKYSTEYGKEVTWVAPVVLAQLMGYEWPGNIRELENLIQRSLVVAAGPSLLAEHLSPFGSQPESVLLSDLEAKWKAHWVREALARQGGKIRETADELGISKRQLQRYAKEFAIDWKKFLAIPLFLLLIGIQSLQADSKPLVLEELVKRALGSRVELKLADLKKEEADAWRLKSRAAMLPRLDLGGSYLRFHKQPSVTLGGFESEMTLDTRRIKEEFPVLGAGPDSVTVPVRFPDTTVDLMGANLLSTGLTIRQPLFSGGRIREKRRQASWGLEMAGLHSEIERRKVIAEVKSRYLKWVYAQRGRRLLSEAAKRVTVVEKFLQNLSENYLPKENEKGISRIDWLAASSMASTILAKRAEAIGQETFALKSLADYCALKDGEVVGENVPLPEIKLPSMDQALERVRKGDGARLAKLQKELASSEVRFAKGLNYPEIGAVGFVNYSVDNFPSAPLWGGGGVLLKFPLFEGGDRQGEARLASVRFRQATYEVEQMEKDLDSTIQSLYGGRKFFEEKIDHLKRGVRQAREARELASESYLLNFGRYEDYLEALKTEIEGEGLLLATELEYRTALVQLEALVGTADE